MLVAALSTGHKIGLGVVGAIFIVFALSASFLAPRRRPDFPGPNGLSVFVILSVALFAAMLTAVEVFGAESEAKAKEPAAAAAPAGGRTVAVTEKEFSIGLPSATLTPGTYTLQVKNSGKVAHDLVVQGPGISGKEGTPLIAPGGAGKVTVTLAKGAYTLFCSVPGHRQAGMVTKLTVG